MGIISHKSITLIHKTDIGCISYASNILNPILWRVLWYSSPTLPILQFRYFTSVNLFLFFFLFLCLFRRWCSSCSSAAAPAERQLRCFSCCGSRLFPTQALHPYSIAAPWMISQTNNGGTFCSTSAIFHMKGHQRIDCPMLRLLASILSNQEYRQPALWLWHIFYAARIFPPSNNAQRECAYCIPECWHSGLLIDISTKSNEDLWLPDGIDFFISF